VKRYYIAMSIRKYGKISNPGAKDLTIRFEDRETGVYGFLPVFTNKRKAAKWGRVVEIKLEGEND